MGLPLVGLALSNEEKLYGLPSFVLPIEISCYMRLVIVLLNQSKISLFDVLAAQRSM